MRHENVRRRRLVAACVFAVLSLAAGGRGVLAGGFAFTDVRVLGMDVSEGARLAGTLLKERIAKRTALSPSGAVFSMTCALEAVYAWQEIELGKLAARNKVRCHGGEGPGGQDGPRDPAVPEELLALAARPSVRNALCETAGRLPA